MRDPGSGLVDLTSWTLVFFGSVPALGPMWRSSGDLGHSKDPQHSLSLALELSRALCTESDAKVSFSKHVCSFPGLTKTPQHLGKAEEGGRGIQGTISGLLTF